LSTGLSQLVVEISVARSLYATAFRTVGRGVRSDFAGQLERLWRLADESLGIVSVNCVEDGLSRGQDRIALTAPRLGTSPATLRRSHDRLALSSCRFCLNEVDSSPAPFRPVGQICHRQAAQGELLEVML